MDQFFVDYKYEFATLIRNNCFKSCATKSSVKKKNYLTKRRTSATVLEFLREIDPKQISAI